MLSESAQRAIDAARKKIITRENPLLEDLPDWVKGFRPHQVAAIEQIMDAYRRGVQVVVCEAPTGSGKTLIGETVRRLLDVRGVYVCSTKSLQDQVVRDYPYAKVLKGRSNYPTRDFPDRFHPGDWMDHLSAEDCTWSQSSACMWCRVRRECPYDIAKGDALKAKLAVINTAYFLAEANTAGSFSSVPFVIADEADTLEGELMGYVSVDVSERRMAKWKWEPPEKVTVKESWKEWIDSKLPFLRSEFAKLDPDPTNLRAAKERKYVGGLREKLSFIRKGLDDDESPWVYTGKGAEGSGRVKAKNKGLEVSFKPARVDMMGQQMLWRHAGKWLLMSATVISSSEMIESLGWTGGYEYVAVPSTFPAENRKIYYKPVGDMSAKKKAESLPKVVDECVRIADERTDERVLIHTVSYDIAAEVYRGLVTSPRPVFTYRNSNERADALSSYIAAERAILIAPSMDRGIDLPDELCRVQIICKVPFPYLGDRQISARMHSRGGDVWYRVQTIRTLVQMTGRGVRSEYDKADTFILDSQFDHGVMSKGRGLLPRWWVEAVVWPRNR